MKRFANLVPWTRSVFGDFAGTNGELFWSTGALGNQKFKITNHNDQIRNSKQAFVFEYWNLRFVCNLVLGICYFAMLRHSITRADFHM